MKYALARESAQPALGPRIRVAPIWPDSRLLPALETFDCAGVTMSLEAVTSRLVNRLPVSSGGCYAQTPASPFLWFASSGGGVSSLLRIQPRPASIPPHQPGWRHRTRDASG